MPEIPENAPQPQDHKPKKSAAARKAEVDGFVLIEQRGVKLKIPIGQKLPMKAFLRFRGLNDDLTEIEDGAEKTKAELMGTRELLGPEQWAAFLSAGPTMDDFSAIAEKLNAATGE